MTEFLNNPDVTKVRSKISDLGWLDYAIVWAHLIQLLEVKLALPLDRALADLG